MKKGAGVQGRQRMVISVIITITIAITITIIIILSSLLPPFTWSSMLMLSIPFATAATAAASDIPSSSCYGIIE